MSCLTFYSFYEKNGTAYNHTTCDLKKTRLP